ncbi:DNA polymerase III subunit gamma/tau [Simiduia sp. 21SJ11W-1]|uniref:DNA polymerase III subunit gamma/tau n=1 Tax=Simiduia sp. 21SJ11W-1 TaxID=2909669 RepID=UPI0020A0E81C|nr:DNA polymerase III subunit gamma/tau [Simiduia sp. 21SJ11W-1]UTA49629.1 DNA polymerase III subunit gamma/tau [Simiduia sp. 21SJ11W-1]
MSYQVLARKWRPRIFREMVGQEHVLQALINALDHNRLHHAYLFTGTRGVGKTTIARILAKCLNCETGVSSEPCGQCSACLEIAQGRFVDLIEVDAASRTKVEDTRELLENVQYAPTRGRYKVYLIDEVHMLSTSSFNALLKTLEEPPPHVKFLLATTDPQKLPVTVLSRCLQFNLKNMNPERIVGHLAFVLEKELVPFDDAALWALGRAADGSMRDALSLTDQAIAFGNGKVQEADVRAMLGAIDQGLVYDMLQALAAGDGQALFAAVNQLAEHAPDYQGALAEMLSVLHRIAIAQAMPEAIDNSFGDRERILALASQLPAEDVQLFYQTALLGRRDLPLAPDPRSGFDMVLLRMMAFKPQGVADLPKAALSAPAAGTPAAVAPAARPPEAATAQATPARAAVSQPATPPPAAPQPDAQAPVATEAAVQQPAPAVPAQESALVQPPAEPQVPSATPQAQDSPPWADDEGESNLYADEPSPAPEPQAAPPEPATAAVAPVEPAQDVGTPAAVAVNEAPQAVQQPTQPQPSQQQSSPQLPVGEVVTPAPQAAPVAAPEAEQAPKITLAGLTPEHWVDLYLALGVGGVLQSTAANSCLDSVEGNQLRFTLDEANANLFDPSHQQRLADVITAYFDAPVSVQIAPGPLTRETPAATAIRLRAEKQARALESVKNHPLLKALEASFQAQLDESTVEPL